MDFLDDLDRSKPCLTNILDFFSILSAIKKKIASGIFKHPIGKIHLKLI